SLRASVTSPGGFAVRSPFRDFVHLKVLQNAKHFAKPPGVMRQLKDDTLKMKFYILTILTLNFFACSTDKKQTTENSNSMLKLYKLIDNQLHYWETWDKDEKSAIVHWGIVGQRG